MARPKATPAPEAGTSSVVADLLECMNKHSTSSKACLQGDMAKNIWGVPVPSLAMQWLIGGSTILPLQRYISISGEPKCYKSTLGCEIGGWFINAGGMHVYLDTENKTSPTMLQAIAWKNPEHEKNRIYKAVTTINEWQTLITKLTERFKGMADRPKGSRVPVLMIVDSLTGRNTEDAAETLIKEGEAMERGFPVGAAKITNFLESFSMLNTTMALGWVQHLKIDMAAASSYTGPGKKEKGATAAAFASSIHLRLSKGADVGCASHDSAPHKEYPVEGRTVYVESHLSCLGPDKRLLPLDLLWQYVPQEDGSSKQLMWYDWDGALGRLLVWMAYSDKFRHKLYDHERKRLMSILHFTQDKTTTVNCKSLGLEGASFTEFGRAIMANPDLVKAISAYLNITTFPDVQNADIEFADE